MIRTRGTVLALAAVLVLVATLPANAYVRTRSTKGEGNPAAWPQRCVFVMPDAAGTPDLPNDQTFAVIQKSIQSWNDALSACGSYFQINYDAPADRDAHYDGFNVVKFRTDSWCHPEDAQDQDVCYSPDAAGITSVFMINNGDPEDGLILDADVELNDIDFTFAVITPGVSPTPREGTSVADLENTLTHELGHLLGLSHTCRDSASFANDVDENGNPPPSCSDVLKWPTGPDKSKIVDATMYNFASPGEIVKRSLSADDAAGVCAAYPADNAPQGTCEHTDLVKYTHRGGCTFGPRAPYGLPLLALGLLVALALRRRQGARVGSWR